MTPLVLVLIVAGVVCAFVWITSLITKEHSWVDRLWSIVPVVYVWIFAAFAGLADARLTIMAILVTLWGARLTFNFARKGGYSGTEDYRWPILRSRINPEALVYTSATQVSAALHRLGVRHRRVNHSDRFAPGPTHVNGLENFWNQARRHLRKYNGIPGHHLHLYLKECEWRFNYGSAGQLLRTLSHWLDDDR